MPKTPHISQISDLVSLSLSKMRVVGRGSRNVGHMLQDAGQLEQNAVTHLRLSKMRVAVACRGQQEFSEHHQTWFSPYVVQ